MQIYDITLPLDRTLACWPGDTPYRYRPQLRMQEGASINLGALEMSVHSGTHIDAPYHYLADGATIEALDPAIFLGPARLLDVTGRNPIRITDLQALRERPAPRILLRTGAWPDPTRFPEAIPVMDEQVPGFLRECGVILVGIDLPSVDVLDSKTLPIHHLLGACGIHILESLALRHVPEGDYELIALPLRLVGADGAPVRAVLRAAGQ
ncbi:MAG: cyclase family protein [Chloroherpetonaceae bacterium]|nr:cyclase family protein [Chthonomonadaceae bacterium]MDW8208725.1 cyclase family protein [Chloroherpetonaceae bacterium]